MDRGLFIVLEGLDCCGKDTQAELLLGDFKRKGYYGCIQNDPRYLSPIGKCYSDMLGDMERETNHNVWLPLALAARVDGLYKPGGTLYLLENGMNVIQTRFNMSGLVYGTTVENKHFSEEAFHYINTIIVPDLTIYIDISPGEAIARLTRREGKQMDHYENFASITKAYQNYQSLIEEVEKEPLYDEKFVKLDGETGVDLLHNNIIAAVEDFCDIEL